MLLSGRVFQKDIDKPPVGVFLKPNLETILDVRLQVLQEDIQTSSPISE